MNAIQLTIRHEEEVLKTAPSCRANELGINNLVDPFIRGRISLSKLVVMDGMQNPMWIEEKKFEFVPTTRSHLKGS